MPRRPLLTTPVSASPPLLSPIRSPRSLSSPAVPLALVTTSSTCWPRPTTHRLVARATPVACPMLPCCCSFYSCCHAVPSGPSPPLIPLCSSRAPRRPRCCCGLRPRARLRRAPPTAAAPPLRSCCPPSPARAALSQPRGCYPPPPPAAASSRRSTCCSCFPLCPHHSHLLLPS